MNIKIDARKDLGKIYMNLSAIFCVIIYQLLFILGVLDEILSQLFDKCRTR